MPLLTWLLATVANIDGTLTMCQVLIYVLEQKMISFDPHSNLWSSSVFQMRKLRHRRLRNLPKVTQQLKAELGFWDWCPGSQVPKSMLLTMVLSKRNLSKCQGD